MLATLGLEAQRELLSRISVCFVFISVGFVSCATDVAISTDIVFAQNNDSDAAIDHITFPKRRKTGERKWSGEACPVLYDIALLLAV